MYGVGNVNRVILLITTAAKNPNTIIETTKGERAVITENGEYVVLVKTEDLYYRFQYGTTESVEGGPIYFEPYNKALQAFEERVSKLYDS